MESNRPSDGRAKCRIFHRWSAWKGTGRVHRYWFFGLFGSGEYDKAEQIRYCAKCSTTQVREVRS